MKKDGLKAGKADYHPAKAGIMLMKLADMGTKLAILEDLLKEEEKEKKRKKRPAKK